MKLIGNYIRTLLKKSFFFFKAIIYKFLPKYISEIFVIDYKNLHEIKSVQIKTFVIDKSLENTGLMPLSDKQNQEHMLTKKYQNNTFDVKDYDIKNNLVQSVFGLSTIEHFLFIEPFWLDYRLNTKHKNNFIMSMLYEDKLLDKDYIRYLTRRKYNNFKNILVLSTASSSLNYYHFLLDMVPKFADFSDYIDQFDKIIFSGPKSQFLVDFLNIFNISDKSIIMENKSAIFACNSLVVGPRSQVGNPTVRVINSIRSLFQDKNFFPPNFPSKIYISRSNASRRRIKNEKQLFDSLSNFGFEMIRLEEYSLNDQVNLFRNAEFIIGPHGAGLANLVFCKPATKVIELFPESYTEPCMYNISKINFLNYHFLIFKETDKLDNFSVNTSRVIKYISQSFS